MVPYQEIIITLRLPRPRHFRELHLVLLENGFRPEDDFYFLPRTDRVEQWQNDDVLFTSVVARGQVCSKFDESPQTDNHGDCDEIRFEYLLATTPRRCITECTSAVEAVSRALMIKDLHVDGKQISIENLEVTLQSMADEIAAEYDEPGSEGLTILIAVER